MKNKLKILILMVYYNRPILVKNALRSILKCNNNHENWVLFFGDDGSPNPGRPIVEDILADFKNQIVFANSNASPEQKIQDGLSIGKYANQAIKESDADVVVTLCDDDEFYPNYFYNLNNFFLKNQEVLYCYSNIITYNPLFQKSEDSHSLSHKYNQYKNPINPVGKLDATQVAWRSDCCKKFDAWFAETTKFIQGKPLIKDTDRSFFENLYNKCGLCYPTNFISQFKGIHDYQLLWHKNAHKESLLSYYNNCQKLSGELF
jgi:glycosyltransferase involved in cell wall biosynthesis